MIACVCGETFENEHGLRTHAGLARREEGGFLLYVEPDGSRPRMRSRLLAETLGIEGRACSLHYPLLVAVTA